jgi:hypothetical protein
MTADERTRADIAQMGRIDTIPTDLLVPHYLIHSYLYYKLDHSVIADHEYDMLAKRIQDEWEEINHRHRKYIQRDCLRTSGFALTYPLRAVGSAKMIYELTKQKSYLTEKERMPINARSKGQRGEREIIDLLQPHINEVSNYNKVEPPFLQRNQMQTHQGGYDIVGLPGYAFEVKRVESEQPAKVAGWWKQAVSQAKNNEVPVLFYRTNKKPWKVRLYVYLPIGAGKNCKVPADITLDHFIFWLKARLHRDQLVARVNA